MCGFYVVGLNFILIQLLHLC